MSKNVKSTKNAIQKSRLEQCSFGDCKCNEHACTMCSIETKYCSDNLKPCTLCNKPMFINEPYTVCEECRIKRAAKREHCRKTGTCVQCNSKPARADRTICETCAKHNQHRYETKKPFKACVDCKRKDEACTCSICGIRRATSCHYGKPECPSCGRGR